jgi:HK97 family phage major capsid protein
VTGVQSYVRLVGDTVLDAVEIAASQLRAGGRFVTPDAVIMHPLDYSIARRTKATTGEYVGGVNVFGRSAPVTSNPKDGAHPELWGLPVVLTSEIAQGTAIVGAFARASMVWIQEGASVRVNPFAKQTSNIVEIICEERLTLGVVAPAALSVVTVSVHA